MSKMVKRVLEQESAIRLVLGADRKVCHLVPTWQDIEVLQSIDQALSPLLSLTDILSGESYVTVSAVLPMVHLIENNILKEDNNDTQLTKDIKVRIITDLKRRYPSSNEVSEILNIATYLDPRFKSKCFTDLEVKNTKDVIALSMPDYLTSSTTPPQPICQPSTSDPVLPEEPPAKRKKNLGSFFKEHEKEDQQVTTSGSAANLSPEQKCRNELEQYQATPKLDFEDNPLQWWKSNSSNYPLLSTVARKYLCVCATSSPSERVFSCSGNIVTPFRTSLNPQKVDMLTFLSKNLE